MDPLALLAELISLPGPSGQEAAVREALVGHLEMLGLQHSTDAKGNLLVPLSEEPPKVVVTAHMDEIAMIVRSVRPDGCLLIDALGGLFAWKIGEGPVQILARKAPIPGVLSFGSIHTLDPKSMVRRADTGPIAWDLARVITGLSPTRLNSLGIRPGTRVVLGEDRRKLTRIGHHVAGFFLDDRADLVSWLLSLEQLKEERLPVLFAATTSEEVGGEGALYLLQQLRPEVCIALELGPDVPDAHVELTDQPTIWVNDSYAAMAAADIELIADVGKELGLDLQYQALSRGGSDASCAASHGLCARPFTLGIPMQNSHGCEVMHEQAMQELARLAVGLVKSLSH